MASESLISFEMLEQIATLVWTQTGNTQLTEHLAEVKLISGLWQKFGGQGEIDALRSQTILNISKYVKDHPRAPKEELAKEIGKQIEDFAKQIENM